MVGQRNCRSVLTRTPDPASARAGEDAAEPRRLRCSATLHRGRRGCRVPHAPKPVSCHLRLLTLYPRHRI